MNHRTLKNTFTVLAAQMVYQNKERNFLNLGHFCRKLEKFFAILFKNFVNFVYFFDHVIHFYYWYLYDFGRILLVPTGSYN